MRFVESVIEARYADKTMDELKAMRQALKMANRAIHKGGGTVSTADRELLSEYTFAIRIRP